MVGYILAPFPGLFVKIMPIGKGPAGKKIPLYKREIPFHFSLSIRIFDVMRDKIHSKHIAEYFHIRSYLSIRTAATRHYHTCVIYNAPGTGSSHKPKGIIQKDPGLKPGESRIVLNEKTATIRKD